MALSTDKYQANAADQPSRDILNDAKLVELAASAAADAVIVTFSALGRKFEAVRVHRLNLQNSTRDGHDVDARGQGYTELDTIIARDAHSKLPYAVWEFYSHGGEPPCRSKSIDVDVHHQRKGLATALWRALTTSGFTMTPSGTQTAAGAALLGKLSAFDGIT